MPAGLANAPLTAKKQTRDGLTFLIPSLKCRNLADADGGGRKVVFSDSPPDKVVVYDFGEIRAVSAFLVVGAWSSRFHA